MNKRQIKAMADTFRIWRFANARNWNVTVSEIADATDLHPVRVFKLCLSRRWTCRLVGHRLGRWNDSAFKRPSVHLDEIRSSIGLPAC